MPRSDWPSSRPLEVSKPFALAVALVVSGAGLVPGSAAADTPAPTAGSVRIPLEAYLELLRRGDLGTPGGKPPVDYILPEADYDAQVSPAGVVVEARIRLEVLARGWVKVPVFPAGVAIESAALDGKPVTLAAFSDADGGAALLLRDPGAHTLTARLRLPLDEARGDRAFELPLRESAITRLTVRVPEAGLEFLVVPSEGSKAVERRPAASVLSAVLPPTTLADVEWRAAPPVEAGASARIAADSATVVHFGDGVLHASTAVKLDVTRAPAPSITFALPAGAEDVDVTGDAVLGHTERVEGDHRLVEVQFEYPVVGTTSLTVTYEMRLPEGGGDVEVPAFSIPGAARDHGMFALSAVSTLEVATPAASLRAVTAIDPSELPAWTPAPSTGDPILFAFRYHAHPYGALAHVIEHEDSPVLTTSVDLLALTTVLTKEGKSVTRALLVVRNNLKQFLQVELPAEHVLWSAFVAGRPVKPARNGKPETLLVPLLRSADAGGTLAAFEVELIYFGTRDALSFLAGGGELDAPITDVPITRMTWDLHLPEGYAYLHPGGDLRPVDPVVVTATVAWDDGRFSVRGGKDAKHRADDGVGAPAAGEDNDEATSTADKGKSDPKKPELGEDNRLADEEPALEPPEEHEKLDYAYGADIPAAMPPTRGPIVKGVLPVRVALPLSAAGTVLRFEKEIVAAGEPAKVRFSYVDETVRGALGAASWPLLLLVGLVLVAHVAALVRRRRVSLNGRTLALAIAAGGLLVGIAWGAQVSIPSVLVPLAASVVLYLAWAIVTGRLQVPGLALARTGLTVLAARLRATMAAAERAAAPVSTAPAAVAPAPAPTPTTSDREESR